MEVGKQQNIFIDFSFIVSGDLQNEEFTHLGDD